jgi:hypothetical protein
MSVRLANGDYLFRNGCLRDYLSRKQERLQEAIRSISRDRILQTPISSLVDELHEQHRIDVPSLPDDQHLEERVQVSKATDTRIDVSGDKSRAIRNRRTPTYIEGTQITFKVHFEGNHELFCHKPNTWSNMPPRASRVQPGGLEFTYEWPNDDGSIEEADEQFRGELSKVRKRLSTVQEQVEETYNGSLRQTIESRLENRKESASEDRSAVESLPYDLERRSEAPETHTVPVERISTDPQPEERKSGETSNWIIEDEVYEEILTVMKNMAWVMERSPSAFEEMDEEDLRIHFLVQLNGQFTGPASGETFNTSGKTDIYLPVKDRAVFIAECKFWRGPKELGRAVDQLLGYSSWRDTKTALIVFNRNQDTSRVRDQIPGVFEGREDHLRTLEYGDETDFRFVLHHGDDPGREVTVTVLVFDVPKN